jgi:hypothetical protein
LIHNDFLEDRRQHAAILRTSLKRQILVWRGICIGFRPAQPTIVARLA